MSYSFAKMLDDLTSGYGIPFSGRELIELQRRDPTNIDWDSVERASAVSDGDYLRALPYGEFLKTSYWRSVRLAVFRKRGLVCGTCGVKRGRVDVHHRTYKNHGHELLHLDDLIVLCRACHMGAHSQALCMNCLCPRGRGLVISPGGRIITCPECSAAEPVAL